LAAGTSTTFFWRFLRPRSQIVPALELRLPARYTRRGREPAAHGGGTVEANAGRTRRVRCRWERRGG